MCGYVRVCLCACVCLGLCRVLLGRESDLLRRLISSKGVLADRLKSVDAAIAAEIDQQQAIALARDQQMRQINAQNNLRKNVDQLAMQLDDANSTDGADDRDAGPTAEEEHQALAASILTLKQQKRVLIKAVRTMQSEREEIQQERIQYEEKLAQLKEKLESL